MFLCLLFEILLIGLLCLLLKRNYTLWAAFSFKVICSLCLFLLYYEYYESGDIMRYFENLENLSLHQKLSFDQQTESRSIFFTKLVYPVFKLSFESNLLTNLNMGLINFISGFLLSTELVKLRLLPKGNVYQFIFLCFPSLMFWTSGMTKETIAMTLVFGMAYLTLYAYRKNKELIMCIAIVIMAMLLYNFKYYQAAITIPFLLLCYFRLKLTKTKFLLGLIGVILITISLAFIHPFTNPQKILETIQSTRNFNLAHNGTSKASEFIYQDNIFSLLLNTPKGLFIGLFAPLKAWNLPSSLAIIENILVLILFIFFIVRFQSLRISSIGIIAILFVISYAVLAGISTPNYGTLSRIKVGYSWIYVLLVINGIKLFNYTALKISVKYRLNL